MSASSGQKLTFEGEELDYNTDRDIQYCIRGSNKKSSIDSFSDPQLGLNGRLLHNMNKAGLQKPTPIQRHGMPQLVAGLDVMCCSHTGSGKTAAYLLPIINSIVGEASASRSVDKGSSSSSEKTSGAQPTALILTPTRELAMQISKDANMFGDGLPVYSFAVFGGQLLGYELETLKEGRVDILVATPGRLLHLLSEFDVLTLGKIQYFVVDEADEMFNRGFFSNIRNIVDQFLIPKVSYPLF
ncbi:unnamed protein product [Orchesella dallaii]|uniref:RNA helicase n=1 Tax=Orchesella dallaii TaxID=48710 RepID=A0ABP1R4D4_9HEXA